MEASRSAIAQARWTSNDVSISISGLRGATNLFEKHHKEYLDTGRHKHSLPTTTLGKYFFMDSS
jgi:hypothetical protein